MMIVGVGKRNRAIVKANSYLLCVIIIIIIYWASACSGCECDIWNDRFGEFCNFFDIIVVEK